MRFDRRVRRFYSSVHRPLLPPRVFQRLLKIIASPSVVLALALFAAGLRFRCAFRHYRPPVPFRPVGSGVRSGIQQADSDAPPWRTQTAFLASGRPSQSLPRPLFNEEEGLYLGIEVCGLIICAEGLIDGWMDSFIHSTRQ
mmetsp:Transcript_27279/g.63909  ORF Transcript_27279/g.63909 Transcript_27279/m.63909 type:complete len:141 (-) Transcript_27279:275-697(-)